MTSTNYMMQKLQRGSTNGSISSLPKPPPFSNGRAIQSPPFSPRSGETISRLQALKAQGKQMMLQMTQMDSNLSEMTSITSLAEQSQALENQIEYLKDERNEQDQQLNRLRADHRTLEGNQHRTTSELRAALLKIKDLVQREESSMRERQRLSSELHDAEDRVTDLNDEICTLRKTQHKEMDQVQSQYGMQRVTDAKQIEALQQMLVDEKQLRIQQEQELVTKHKSALSQMEDEFERLRQNEMEQEQRAKRAFLEKNDLNLEIEKMKEQFNGEKQDWYRMKSHLNDLISEKEVATKAIQQQMDKLQVKHQRDLKALQDSYDTLRQQFERERETWKRTEDNFVERQRQLEDEIKSQHGKCFELQEKLEKVQKEYDISLTKLEIEGMERSNKKINELQQAYDALLKKSAVERKAQEKIEDELVMENERIRKKMESEKESQQRAQRVVARLQREMELQKKEYKQQVQELRTIRNTLSEKLKTTQNALAQQTDAKSKEYKEIEKILAVTVKRLEESEKRAFDLETKLGTFHRFKEEVEDLRNENKKLAIRLKETQAAQQAANTGDQDASKLMAARELLRESQESKLEMQREVEQLRRQCHLLRDQFDRQERDQNIRSTESRHTMYQELQQRAAKCETELNLIENAKADRAVHDSIPEETPKILPWLLQVNESKETEVEDKEQSKGSSPSHVLNSERSRGRRRRLSGFASSSDLMRFIRSA